MPPVSAVSGEALRPAPKRVPSAPHAAGFVFMADAGHKGVRRRRFCRMKNRSQACAGSNDFAVRIANPLPLVLFEELVPTSPILRLILAPLRINLPGDFGREFVSETVHGNFQTVCNISTIQL